MERLSKNCSLQFTLYAVGFLLLTCTIRMAGCILGILRWLLSYLLFSLGLRRKILILGPAGAGKSKLGNFILKGNHFKTSVGAIEATRDFAVKRRLTCSCSSGEICCLFNNCYCEIYVTDSPALKNNMDYIRRVFEEDNVADAILLVIDASKRFTAEEQQDIQALSQIYQGGGFWERVILVISHADVLGNTLFKQREAFDQVVRDRNCPESLKWLVQQVNWRFYFIDIDNLVQPERDLELNRMMARVRSGNAWLRFRLRIAHICRCTRDGLGGRPLYNGNNSRDYNSFS